MKLTIPDIPLARIEHFIEQFHHKRLLVIGDMMLDSFIWGAANRISPEAPVPVVEIEHESVHLGGAGNVIQNLSALGAQVKALGIVGCDEAGQRIISAVEDLGVDASSLLEDPSRPTTRKTRIIAHHQQVVRADRESRQPLDHELTHQLIERFTTSITSVDGVIVSDYDKGTLTPTLLQAILPLAREAGKPVFVDPKVRNFRSYSPATFLKPNQREAAQITQIELVDESSIAKVGWTIRDWLRCDYLLITHGEAGMTLFSGEKEVTRIPTAAQEVYDVTGAGDTSMAVLGLSFVSGATALEAAVLANYAASVVIAKVGTATVNRDELLKAYKLNRQSKIVAPSED